MPGEEIACTKLRNIQLVCGACSIRIIVHFSQFKRLEAQNSKKRHLVLILKCSGLFHPSIIIFKVPRLSKNTQNQNLKNQASEAIR